MKIAHNIRLSVFAKEDEDAGAIKQKLISLVPFDLEQEKLELKSQTAQGFQEKKIRIYELTLTKERHTNKFLQSLKECLDNDQKELLIGQRSSRLDQELNFFIRLDKTNLLQDDKLIVTDSGSCFHIRISIAAYPANRDTAMQVVKKWLGE